MRIRFRGQYASFFFAPLVIMIFIYGHIFVIIRRHQVSRRALTQHATVSTGGSRSTAGDNSLAGVRYHSSASSPRRFSSNGTNKTNANKRISPSLRGNRNTSYAEEQNSTTAVTRNIKVGYGIEMISRVQPLDSLLFLPL